MNENKRKREWDAFTGLGQEVYTTIVRYFAPVVAIYDEFEKAIGTPSAWQRKKLNEDRGIERDHG